MGCTKCKQENIYKEKRYNEIINPYLNKSQTNFKSVSILDELNNKIENNNNNLYNVYNKKEILEDEEMRQLDEITKKIKTNKRLLKILKKCQSIILGIQVRKKIRYDKLRRAKTISLEALLKKDCPLQKFQIENFFKDNPPKIYQSNLKIIRSEPVQFEKGIIYIGEWEMNFFQRFGRGIQIYPDSSYYKGYWENDKAQGEGEFIHSTGDKYIGEWQNNKRHGKGKYISRKGKEYEGYWKDDKPEGEGKEILENGNVYIGPFVKGLKNGKGFLQMKNGCTYDGNFVDGKMNGIGVYTFNDKRVYQGDFVNNTFEGKGKYSWPNGNVYNGYFKNNNRDGFGTFFFKDGKKYRGKWKDGKLDGDYDVYNPNKGRWIKKKGKEENDDLNSNAKKSNANSVKMKSDGADEFNNGKILDMSGLDDLEEIKKDEYSKIEINIEDEF